MNRRGFLGALGVGAISALTLDPERALWVPGKKLISIPKPAARVNFAGDIVWSATACWVCTKTGSPGQWAKNAGGFSATCTLTPASVDVHPNSELVKLLTERNGRYI